MAKKKNKDPHAAREAKNYQNPIPSREFILELLEKKAKPLSRKEIGELLNLHDADSQEALRRRLRAMERDGQLVFTRRQKYGLVNKMNLVRGRVIGHPDGFGFLVPEEGGDDIFLPAREMRSLMHGDRALVGVAGVDRRGRREGNLVEVLERAHHSVVGRLFIEKGVSFVVPDNKRIHQDVLVAREDLAGARHGQIVIVEIIEQPSRYRQPIGRVREVLGEHMAPGMEIDVAIRSHELPVEWSRETEDEIADLSPEVTEAEKQGRVDIRHLSLVTIDGEDARDFDDAVYCEPDGDGWRLLVAIADVSHYVNPETALDADAYERATSVYFPERVIPMLPEILSNGLCSLNPEVDRLCMVCDMKMSAEGKLLGSKFYPAVMYSHARLTYTKVANMLVDQDANLRVEYQHVLPHLENLYSLYKVMRQRREERGAIDFESTETRILFGEQRKIERIVPLVRNDAHKLIEEFMIMANVATARYLLAHKIPALYRIHEGPTAEKIEALREFLSEFGLQLGGGDEPTSADYAVLLKQVAARPDAHLIQTVMLRSLRQAVYSPDNIGHFGLAFDAYAHFTSPIRRYPDLTVHRAIRHILSRRKIDDYIYSHEDMVNIGEHCSVNERRADEATRDAVDWLKCEFMMDKVGEEFDGTISTVTSFGLFIELDEIYVEGLIHVTGLDNDYYVFDPVKHRMIGERTNKTYRLGDRLRVKVARVDLDEKKIDFSYVGEAMTAKPKPALVDEAEFSDLRTTLGGQQETRSPLSTEQIEAQAGSGRSEKSRGGEPRRPEGKKKKSRKRRRSRGRKKPDQQQPVTASQDVPPVNPAPAEQSAAATTGTVKKKVAKKAAKKKATVVTVPAEQPAAPVSKKKATKKKASKKKASKKKASKKKAASKKTTKKKVARKKTASKQTSRAVAKKKVSKKKTIAKKTTSKKVARKKVSKKKTSAKKVASKKVAKKKTGKKNTAKKKTSRRR